MSKQITSRPGQNGNKPGANKGPAKPTSGARKSPGVANTAPQQRSAAQTQKTTPNRVPPTSGAARPGVTSGMTAQQRVQAQQAAARKKSTGGFKIRPLDIALLVVGLIVVGFVVWSIASGSNQQTQGQAGGPTAESTPLPVGVPAPNFTYQGTDGKNYSLSDYKGKVVLLEFFAPWCPHCQNDAPMFNKVAERFAGKDVQLLAVSASPFGKDYNPPSAEPPISMDDLTWFKDQFKVNFPILLDKELKSATDYSIMFYPTVYLVDKQGNIAGQPAGFFTWKNGKPESQRDEQLTEESLAARIEELLK
jgi:thiol-disulfide isomerase/thioredoxin